LEEMDRVFGEGRPYHRVLTLSLKTYIQSLSVMETNLKEPPWFNLAGSWIVWSQTRFENILPLRAGITSFSRLTINRRVVINPLSLEKRTKLMNVFIGCPMLTFCVCLCKEETD